MVAEEKSVEFVDYEWQEYASCLNMSLVFDPNDNPFFKEGRGPNYPMARIFCAGCPVVVDCLIEGLHEDNVGFWGCMSPNERAQVRRRLRRGVSFFNAVEEVWGYHRKQKRFPVPTVRVWSDWEI